jgi:hypothetical protein
MTTAARCACIACLIALIVPGLVLGRVKNNYVAPEARSIAGGRDLQIVVVHPEIGANFKPVDLMSPFLGGLVGALIQSRINTEKSRTAELSIVPLRDALVDFDFDAFALNSSTAALSKIDWLDLKETRISRDSSEIGLVKALNGAATSQVMFLYYDYAADADFSSVVVAASGTLVNKAMPRDRRVQKPSMRFWPNYLAFNQTVRSVIRLRNADHRNPEANLGAWSADHGRLARAALELGTQRCLQMLQQSLEMSASEAADMQKQKDRKMYVLPGVPGWVLESDASHLKTYSAEEKWITYYEKIDATPSSAPQTDDAREFVSP